MKQDTEVVKLLCAPPWNFGVHRAWAIVEQYQMNLDALDKWHAFAKEAGQRLAAHLITKQAEPPPKELTATQKILAAMEKART